MKKIREKLTKKKIIGILVCIVLFLAYEFGLKAAPFDYDTKEVESITVLTVLKEPGLAVIKEKKDIRRVMRILKSIDAYRGPYSVYDLAGDTPDAEVTIHLVDDYGYGHNIRFSGGILVDDEGNFYKVRMSELKKLYKIKKKYEKNDTADSDA
ncbi:MAG: hypothetical protein J1E62_05700 [Lachnospiraceae bacterium]|nr:hypothetical protein [Lachnospiraceae bacterium]